MRLKKCAINRSGRPEGIDEVGTLERPGVEAQQLIAPHEQVEASLSSCRARPPLESGMERTRRS